MSAGLRALLVDDSEQDSALLVRYLESAGFEPTVERLDTASSLEAALRRARWDIALVDYSLPGFSGPAAVALVHELCPDLPCIIVSGTIDEDAAVAALRGGAVDFVLKDNLRRLGPAIERELRDSGERAGRQEAERALALRDRELGTLVDHVPDVIARVDRDLRIRFVNPAITDALGVARDQVTGTLLTDMVGIGVGPHMLERWAAAVQSVLDHGAPATVELAVSGEFGRRVLDTLIVAEQRDGEGVSTVLSIGRDVTAAKELAEERARLLASERAARAEAEAAIQRLASTLESIGDAFIALDRDWHITYVNQAAIRTVGPALGFSAVKELLGQQLWNVLRSKPGRLVRPEFERALREGVKTRLDEYFPALDAWLQVDIYPTPSGLSVFFRDVTELRRAEDALRRSEEHFRALIENTTDVITLTDAEGIVQYESPSAERVFGRKPEERVGSNAFAAVHPADLPRLKEAFAAAIASGSMQVPFEYRYLDASGDWVYVESTGINLLDNPAVAALVIHSRDVSVRYAVQQQVRFQAALLDIVGQAVIATDLEGRITYWNRGATAGYGWTLREALGRPLAEMLIPEGGRADTARIFEQLGRGESWSGEVEVRSRDGRIFPVLSTNSPLLDEAGRLVGFVGVSTDLTERKALEAQLRQGQKMEAIGRLAGGVAHDFNNLLTAIKGNVDFLLAEIPPSSPAHEDAEQILHAADQAADLTHQLLAFGRRQLLDPKDVELNEVIADLEKMLRRLIGERIHLRTELFPGLTTVHADPGQLRQVLVNLVVNARDAMPEGGEILLRTIAIDVGDAPGPCECLQPGPHVCLSVSDTGCGMSAEVVQRIFEPFFTTKEEGNGFGLATSYGIVAQSGGGMRVESEPGRGSSFHVYLPRVLARSIASQPPQSSARIGGGPLPTAQGETILLVEDEAPVRAVAARTLRNRGFNVLEASCGKEALALVARDRSIVLLITDVVMPDLGGPALAELVGVQRPGLPVLFMSGYSAEEVDAGTALSGRPFIQKPFTTKALARQVSEIVAGARVAQTAGAQP